MSFQGAVPHFTLQRGKPRRLLCIRPADPTLAVNMATALGESLRLGKITPAEFDRKFQDMISLQEYRFVGFVLQPVKLNKEQQSQLVNHLGDAIGWSEVGDSFVPDSTQNLREAGQPIPILRAGGLA